jgi:ketosteroid isomerase-like protein
MSEENVEIVRRAWDAFLRGDLDAMAREWAPDIVWETEHFRDWPENRYDGVEGVRRFLAEWRDLWPDQATVVEDIRLAPDGRVVALVHYRLTGRSSGLGAEMKAAQIVTIKDGKVVRLANYDDRSEALEAAGLAE